MSTRVTIFNQNAMKEYFLPEQHNIDFAITIKAGMFEISEDKELRFEEIEGTWYVLDENGYDKTELVDAEMYVFRFSNGTGINMFVMVCPEAGISYEKFDLNKIDSLTFGKGNNNTIRYAFDKKEESEKHIGRYVHNAHFEMHREGNGFVIESLGQNGIFVDSKFVNTACVLNYGDTINAYGLRAVYLGDILAVNMYDSHLSVDDTLVKVSTEPEIYEFDTPEKKFFHRSPRSVPELNTEVVDIEAPPQRREDRRKSILSTIGPSMTMALPMLMGCLLSAYATTASGRSFNPMMFTGIVTAVGSASIGTFWALRNIKIAKKEAAEDERKRYDAYGQYLIDRSNEIQEKYNENINTMNQLYPESSVVLEYDRESAELWNRNPNHKDFLFERLGIGTVPFQAEIKIPKDRFSMVDDALAEKPMRIYESFHELHDVPVGINLMGDKIIGITGNGDALRLSDALRTLILQIVANNCYSEVKLAFAFKEGSLDAAEKWGFVRWLPHVWSEDKKARYVAFDKEEASDVFYELTKVFRRRLDDEKRNKGIPRPYYILIVDGPDMLESELIGKYIFADEEESKKLGLTTIFLADRYEELPNDCTLIVENSETFQGFYHVTDAERNKMKVNFDSVSYDDLEYFSRKIANIEVNESEVGAEIPSALTFFDMYGVNTLQELNVLDRWRKNRNYENMRALVGHKGGGQPCYLDVHEKYHGPHGLVAGTTGSGKSETLQTYILSLALNFSPNDVGFFLIDYKGGGMANLFDGLPHLIGSISNLSGNQVRRAMVSIKSENLRRQRIFNEHGVNNINLYTRLVKSGEATLPVPHLFIVIDEFAELKREEPEFMRQLISVAQVGRSLGVHLILATQKPAGTVDDNIWSNSKFKLCLRVQDKQDSNDMLHKPDAAYLTQAGRCYLQVGNDEIYELFQSGYSGAIYDESAGAAKLEMAKMISNTGKAALVGNLAKKKQKEIIRRNWNMKLVECLKMSGYVVTKTEDLTQEVLNMYDVMVRTGLEYEDSEFNRRKLASFINLYNEAVSDSSEVVSSEEIADKIIKMAEERGAKLPEAKEKTQLDAVVEYLGRTAEENGYKYDLKLWMPLLPTNLPLDEIEGYKQHAYSNGKYSNNDTGWTLQAITGLIDDPERQLQMPLVMDFAEMGHYVICGTVSSGKSTFMQTILYSLINRYTPEHLNIYALDFSSRMLSPFEKAPHFGGVFYETDIDTIGKLFFMINNIVAERKALLKGGNYEQYVKVNGVTIPSIVIAIDNYANFREKTGSKYDDIILKLAKEGTGYGIHLLFTAGGYSSSDLPSKVADNFKGTITLELSDKFAYSAALRVGRIPLLPEAGVKGRGLVPQGETILEYQAAVCLKADDDYQKIALIEEKIKDIAANWKGRRARCVPFIPEKPTYELFCQRDEIITSAADPRCLSLGYDLVSAAIFNIDLAYTYSYMITGKSKTGKSNVIKLLINNALLKKEHMQKGKVVIFDSKTPELGSFKSNNEVMYIQTDQQIFDFFNQMIPTIKERSLYRNELREKDLSEEEVFEGMQKFEQYFIFVPDVCDFIERLYKPEEGVGNMSGFFENIINKGDRINIFFFSCLNTDDYSTVNVRKSFSYMTKDKWGIHLGGNIMSQKIFTFDNADIHFTEQSKASKPGIGIVPDNESFADTKKVVIPKIGK